VDAVRPGDTRLETVDPPELSGGGGPFDAAGGSTSVTLTAFFSAGRPDVSR
jgi:hypothetical protein